METLGLYERVEISGELHIHLFARNFGVATLLTSRSQDENRSKLTLVL